MSDESDEDSHPCADCREDVSPVDRVYALGSGLLLCWECAVKRGGAYDDARDRWIVAPRVSDLLDARVV